MAKWLVKGMVYGIGLATLPNCRHQVRVDPRLKRHVAQVPKNRLRPRLILSTRSALAETAHGEYEQVVHAPIFLNYIAR